jgi:hypothetical protein
MASGKRLLSLIVLSSLWTAVSHAEPARSIRVADRGPFKIWNGLDGDAPRGSGRRVLAVSGATKSFRVNYSASMAPPHVRTGIGHAEIIAGPGTTIDFGGPRGDCYSDRIVYCMNGPISGYPPGTILCMCTVQTGATCCTSDTGILMPKMIPIDVEL